MGVNLVSVLCEGPHDVAFLVKILKTVGYKTENSLTIKEFPPPYNALIEGELKNSKIEGLNIQNLRKSLVPSEILSIDNNYLFFYALGGDGKVDDRRRLLRKLYDLVPSEEGEIGEVPAGTSLSCIYFFDADTKGVKARHEEVRNEIKLEIPDAPERIESDTSVDMLSVGNGLLTIGTYIFSSQDDEKGDLEDILVPLMRKNNEAVFEEAEAFLKNHFSDERLFKLKIKDCDGVLSEERSEKKKEKHKFDQDKSLIGVVGQLQKSGSSNVVCIGQTDYLSKDKIDADSKCQEIIAFFKSIL